MIRKKSNDKKTSTILIVILMLNMLIGILPSGFFSYANDPTVPEATYGGGDDPTVTEAVYFITDIELTDLEGNPLPEPVEKDAELRITYYFEIPNTMDVKEGDEFTITVPDEIQKINKDFLDYPLNDENGNTIAHANFYTDNRVKIVFTDYAEQEGLGDIEGNFWVERRFESSKIDNDGESDIVFDLNGECSYEIKVKFETVPEETNVDIRKSNRYNAENNEITWTIKINPETSPTPNLPISDVVITDVIEDNQEYVPNSFSMEANISGWNKDSEVTVSEPSGGNRELKITFNDPINTFPDEVYTIKFKTHPDITAFTSEGQSISFENTAKVQYKDVETGEKREAQDKSTKKITADFIKKTGVHNKDQRQIKWEITINSNYLTIPAGAKIEDSIPDGLTLDQDSIYLDGTQKSIGGQLTYDEVGKKLTYTFETELNEPHTLSYITDVTDPEAYESNEAKTYTNEAVFIGTGIPVDAEVGKKVTADTEVIRKKGLNNDPSKHEMEWEIVVNDNKIVIQNPVVTDIIPEGLEYIENSFTVNGTQTNSGFQYDDTTNTFTYDFTDEKTDNKINGPYTLKFKTKVLDNRVYAVNGSEKFTNEATLNGDNIPESIATASKNYVSKVIEKSGIGYDYIDRMITWKIVVNQNQMEMKNAYIEDIIPEGQAFVESSVEINGATAPMAGSEGYSYDENSKLLKYTFPATINTTQTITFQTKITDLSIFNENGPIDVDNTVKLYGDDIPDNVESTGDQRVDCVVVSKTGEYETGDSFIGWTVIVNKNQLEINNPVLEDTLQEGLSLDTATIQLFELEVKPDGSHSVGDEVAIEGDNFEYNETTRVFKFFFNDTITKAYLLKFQTDIASTHNDATFSNTIDFLGSYGNETGTSDEITVEVQEVGGGASGKNGSITLTKVDKNDDAIKLENAKFQVLNRFGEAVGEVKSTDQEGTVVFDKLKLGIPYTIKEVEAPKGYTLMGSGEYTFTLSSGEKDLNYTMENEMIKGNIQFKKVDGDTKTAIEGAVFELFKETEQDHPIAEATSNSEGMVSFKDVIYGSYLIKEKNPAQGYLPADKLLKARITQQGETVYAHPESSSSGNLYPLENTPIKGSLKVLKVDENDSGIVLENAEFKIFKVTDSGEVLVDTMTTDQDGLIQIDHLVYGEYVVREVKAPEGYYINNNDHQIIVANDGETIELTVENKKIPVGTLVINKLDAWHGTPLAGVAFEIYNEANELVKTVKTNEDGMVNISNLPTGSYKVKEVGTLEGYHEFAVEKTVEIKSDESINLTVENHPLRTLLIKKVASGNTTKVLEGAAFEVKNDQGELIEEISTDEERLAKLEGLVFGEYTVKEIKAPRGYKLDSTEFKITIDEETPAIYEIERENTKKSSSGGGGGGGDDPDPEPDPEEPDPEEPDPEPDPSPEPDPKPDPEPEPEPSPEPEPDKPVIEEDTPKDTPVDGEVDVPEEGEPEIVTPPENGEVDIDEDGKWTYTPDPGFVGKDKFMVKIKDPDGTEEEILIEIDVEDVPLGTVDIPGDEALPQTGESNPLKFYFIGTMMILFGVGIKVSKKYKWNIK